MGKIRIIAFYLITLIGLILEIIFLFEIPYYRYSYFLKYLKIIRILFGFVIFLIDIYFRFTAISEMIWDFKNKIRKKDNNFQDKNIFFLIHKIFIISGFVISLTCLILNITGVVLASNYLSKDNSTDLQNKYWTCSLLLLFENILITICWIYFSIYWALNIYSFIKKSKNEEKNNKIEEIKDEDINGKKYDNKMDVGVAPPPSSINPIQNEQNSSEREINIISNKV